YPHDKGLVTGVIVDAFPIVGKPRDVHFGGFSEYFDGVFTATIEVDGADETREFAVLSEIWDYQNTLFDITKAKSGIECEQRGMIDNPCYSDLKVAVGQMFPGIFKLNANGDG